MVSLHLRSLEARPILMDERLGPTELGAAAPTTRLFVPISARSPNTIARLVLQQVDQAPSAPPWLSRQARSGEGSRAAENAMGLRLTDVWVASVNEEAEFVLEIPAEGENNSHPNHRRSQDVR
jgi:hypothetical protein